MIGNGIIRRLSPLYLDQPGEGFDVVVALDDHVTRTGICTMLEQVPVVRTAVSCESLDEAIQALAVCGSCVLVLPCVEPESQVERLADLASANGTRILILLEDGDLECIGRSMSIEPDGFLLRSELTLEVLWDTLVRLVRHELPVPRVVVRSLLTREGIQSSPHRSRVLLTGRERQTLELLVEGFSNKQIARRLGISDNSAKRYVANVLAKLNCPNRTSAVAWALKSGLVDEA